MPAPTAWRECQLRVWAAWTALACALAAATLALAIPSEAIAEVAVYAAAACGVLAAAAIVRLVIFRCPRCGHMFAVRVGPWPFPDRKPSSRHCVHCWLPKWADPDEVPEELIDETDDW